MTVLRFLKAGQEQEHLSAQALDDRANQIASLLLKRTHRGDRVLLLFKPGLDFVAAFIACLRAGTIAVPSKLPNPQEDHSRLTAIISQCEPTLTLSHAEARAAFETFDSPLPVVEVDDIKPQSAAVILPRENDIAYLQYTSGSTSAPKAVKITQTNLITNVRVLVDRFNVRASKSLVSWLPHYHDMGLVGPILCSLVAGRPAILMSPADFLRRPVSWLDAISRYHAGIITAPTFAYELCARALERTSATDLTGLDLSCVGAAIVGAEMIRESSLAHFARATSRYGFSSSAFYPAYGLAESTLFVDGVSGPLSKITRRFDAQALANGQVQLQTDTQPGKALVACGAGTAEGVSAIVIADLRKNKIADSSSVGEICITGPSVTPGYWGHEAHDIATMLEQLPHRRLLRTGDLGFVFDNLLFVVGRKDDLIVLNGVNYYPDDLEQAACSARPETENLKAAAFCEETEDGAHLVIMQERRHRKKDCVDDDVIAAAIRKVVYQHCNVLLHNIILVPPGKLPITSSGKIRRRRCRELYRLNQFPPNWTVVRWSGAAKNANNPGIQAGINPAAGLRLEALLAMMSEVLECPSGQIDTRLPITAYPFDSIKLVDLILMAETRFGWNLSVDQLISANSIKALADDWSEFEPLDPGQLWADASLPASIQPQPGPLASDGDIVLTGATGLLGSRLVAELLKRSDRAIKCLVRHPKAHALSRLEARLRSLGISRGTTRHRVECIEADISDLALGVTEKQYALLANRSGILINCAAILDFVRPYMALRPVNVEGARAMINLLAAGRPKRLFQISSISVLETPLKASQVLSEQEPLDYPETLTTGYSQTKWVADVMVSHARSRGFSASIVRLPWLIDAPAQNATASGGFLLRLFESCAELGCLPETVARFNIVSAEFAARTIAAIALAAEIDEPTIHLGADRGLGTIEIQKALEGRGAEIKLVKAAEWLEQLNRALRKRRDHPLRAFAPLFLSDKNREAPIVPYLAGQIPEMNSTATALTLTRLGISGLATAIQAQSLLSSVWDMLN